VYDRGVADGGAHQRVDAKIFSSPAVGLPSPAEVPGCSIEVQNYHIPPVGSFHQKTVIVDREVALLSSNNVQNRVSSSQDPQHHPRGRSGRPTAPRSIGPDPWPQC
jgi:hypothetical protein